MAQKILVTGAKGLIGSALVTRMRQSDYEPVCFDVKATGTGFGDVENLEFTKKAARDCVGIVHLAAVSRVAPGEDDPIQCLATNVSGTRNVITAAVESACRPWLLFSSSREVYGDTGHAAVDEQAPVQPINCYGRSKAAAEGLLASARVNGLQCSSLRLSSVYGGVHDHADRVIPSFISAALSGQPLLLRGTEKHFDFTHVDDVVRAIVMASDLLSQGVVLPAAINISSGQSTSLRRLASAVKKAASSRSPVVEISAREYEVSGFVGANDLARQALGWLPKIELSVGISNLIHQTRQLRPVSPMNERQATAVQA